MGYVILRDEHKQIRDEWNKILKIKFNDMSRKRNATEYEKKIID